MKKNQERFQECLTQKIDFESQILALFDTNSQKSITSFGYVVVIDRNSVSVNGMGQKYRFRYRSRNFFRRNQNSFFFPNFTHSFILLGEIQVFYKLENKPSPTKIIQMYLIFGRKFGFRGPFMMEKTLMLSVTRFSL